MSLEAKIDRLSADVAEIKAMLRCGASPEFKPTIAQELDAIKAQGLDIGEIMHARGKAAMRAAKTKRGRK